MKKMLDEKYLVHDELLYELYNLKLDTIKYEIINGVPYLTNIVNKVKFQIGFRVRIDSKLDDKVKSGTFLNQIDCIMSDDNNCFMSFIEDELNSKYSKFLCLSNIEKYLMNVLLDKYLDNHYDSFISLKEIEINYRSTAMSYRNITLNDETYYRYLETIKLLLQKEIYIKTNDNFRKTCYGVNNLEASHPLLEMSNCLVKGSKNIEFYYSFGVFGNIIYNSKRYSTIATAHAFKVNLNQVKRNLVAMWIARKVYIEQGMRSKAVNPKSYFEIDIAEVTCFVNDAFSPISSNYERYKRSVGRMIARTLRYMKKEKTIFDYKYIENNIKVREREEIGNSIEEFLANCYKEPKIVTKYIREFDIVIYYPKSDKEYGLKELSEDILNEQ